jgi:integrase
MKLTAKAVEKLRHEGALHFRDIKDDGTPGLYLRVFKSGKKRYIKRFKLGGKTHAPNLFRDEDARKVGLAKARTKSFAWDALIRAGRDPAAEERRKAAAERRLPTVKAFAAEYIERHAKPNKRSWREDERLLCHDVLPAIGDLRVDTVTRRDIVLMLDAIRDRGAAVLANRALAVTRRMFAFAVERGVIEASPFVGVRASRETARSRALSDDEIRLLWAATTPASPGIEPTTRLALRLLLLTGARAGEVCGTSWGEIHTGEWVIPAARTKNGREHRIPLSDAAMEIVHEATALRTGSWLLPARGDEGHVTPSGVLQAAQRILGDGVTVHDIRRSVATGLQRLGIRLEVTEAVLNHLSGTRAGVVGIYQRHDWSTEKRAAWTRGRGTSSPSQPGKQTAAMLCRFLRRVRLVRTSRGAARFGRRMPELRSGCRARPASERAHRRRTIAIHINQASTRAMDDAHRGDRLDQHTKQLQSARSNTSDTRSAGG